MALAMILMQGKIIFGLPDNFLWLGSGYLSIIPIPVIHCGRWWPWLFISI